MSRRTVAADVPVVLYGEEEAAAALRLSRSVLYELIRSRQLRTVKQGRRRWCGSVQGLSPGRLHAHML
jgi:excisionase family DNA binding protein